MPELLRSQRRQVADAALADYDFKEEIVTDVGRWDDDQECWTCDLAIDGDGESYHRAFIVWFLPGTAKIDRAHPGDRRG